MKGNLKVYLTGLIFLFFATGFFSDIILPAKTSELLVMKIGDKWKIVDANEKLKTKVKVKKNDTIEWMVEGTDAYFQFPVKLFNPVSQDDSLMNGYTKFVRDGKKLKLKVKDDAPAGTYEYAVFCTADALFAEGDSPPVIIIE